MVRSEDDSFELRLERPEESEGTGAGYTNPEQLLAAAMAASFSDTVSQIAAEDSLALGPVEVKVTIHLGEHPELGGGLLEAEIDVLLPDMETEEAEDLINEAYDRCPYCRAMEDNIDISLNLLA